MNRERVLIDSHVLIWLLFEPNRIGTPAQNLIQRAEVIYLSMASLWELALKFSKGKLAYSPDELINGAQELGLTRLSLQDAHIRNILQIKLSHKDPFDKLLLAQSESEGCTLLTADRELLKLPYNTTAC